MRAAIAISLLLLPAIGPSAAAGGPADDRHAIFDQILDEYVRDGLVYYRALKMQRAGLDGYVRSLADASIASASRDEQLAFWLNAYNALVLRTVIDHYPMPRRSTDYPVRSIRQIPGAFERLQHRVAGRLVTLDEIERTLLPPFRDPRVYLAIGRGAVDGGRLRSEMFVPARLEAQLTEVARECITRTQCITLDRETNKVAISAVFSWREPDFVAAYAGLADERFSSRSPIERAVLAFIEPKLLPAEQTFLAKNEFQVVYKPFDWNLNDLTGRGGR